nr:GDP-L-galactose phosphorylase 1-like [Tanacetum cinerariifolium]
ATPLVDSIAKEVVSPYVVDKTMAKEKQSSLLNTTGLGSYPPLPIQETTSAGNALSKSSYANVTESVRAISDRFAYTAYGFFLGKRVAYLVVANYIEVLLKSNNNNPLTDIIKDGSNKVYATNSLLEQWWDSYPDNDDYDPYDDDMYNNHDLSEHLQSICDDLDITAVGVGVNVRIQQGFLDEGGGRSNHKKKEERNIYSMVLGTNGKHIKPHRSTRLNPCIVDVNVEVVSEGITMVSETHESYFIVETVEPSIVVNLGPQVLGDNLNQDDVDARTVNDVTIKMSLSMEYNVPDEADFNVRIPVIKVEEVNNRIRNPLYGYLIDKGLALLDVELYIRFPDEDEQDDVEDVGNLNNGSHQAANVVGNQECIVQH